MRHLRPVLLALPAALALAAPVAAACSGETVLACAIGSRTLDLCLDRDRVTYAYGPAGRPELTLSEPLSSLAYTPWNGIGRAIWESTVLTNGPYGYEVWQSLDKMTANPVWEGGVNVTKGESLVASLSCTPGTLTAGMERLSEAKHALGQCWNPESPGWSTDCN